MKGQIVYIKGHDRSQKQANQALQSFNKYKWDVELKAGNTKNNIKNFYPGHYTIIANSRLHNFREENYNKYQTKISCAFNHVHFWEKVISEDQPMCFLEHDAICCMTSEEYDFEEYLILNAEFVFKSPNKLGLRQFKDFTWPSFGINDLPESYPLKYYKENVWKGYNMAPGTGAYAITPQGAKKLLSAINKYGFDQSDFMINSFNIRMQYLNPSPIKFNTINLSTSYGL